MPDIALFPLGSPLLPGAVLPLHIFEQRYRDLVRDLVSAADSGDQAAFGVVAIREGHEVGHDAASALFDVGCLAQLRAVGALPDGRFEVVTIGTRRFSLRQVHADVTSYLQASVTWLGEPAGAEPERWVGPARAAFDAYRAALPDETPAAGIALPEDPTECSYAIAAAVQSPLRDRQRALAAEDTTQRLRLLIRLMERERALLEQLHAVPADGLLRPQINLN